MNAEQRAMLLALLQDRFQLKYHRETREGPVYLLVRGNKPLRMTGTKDPDGYPWSGGLRGGMIMGDGLAGNNENMPDLAWRLSRYLERPVVDQTGLEGSYDFRTEYSREGERTDVISMILTCVQDLGLKLETDRGPVETIVIDGMERPGGN